MIMDFSNLDVSGFSCDHAGELCWLIFNNHYKMFNSRINELDSVRDLEYALEGFTDRHYSNHNDADFEELANELWDYFRDMDDGSWYY